MSGLGLRTKRPRVRVPLGALEKGPFRMKRAFSYRHSTSTSRIEHEKYAITQPRQYGFNHRGELWQDVGAQPRHLSQCNSAHNSNLSTLSNATIVSRSPVANGEPNRVAPHISAPGTRLRVNQVVEHLASGQKLKWLYAQPRRTRDWL